MRNMVRMRNDLAGPDDPTGYGAALDRCQFDTRGLDRVGTDLNALPIF
jgi:hypothetical protein